MLKGKHMNLIDSSFKFFTLHDNITNPTTFLGLGLDFGMQHSFIIWTDLMHSYVIQAT